VQSNLRNKQNSRHRKHKWVLCKLRIDNSIWKQRSNWSRPISNFRRLKKPYRNHISKQTKNLKLKINSNHLKIWRHSLKRAQFSNNLRKNKKKRKWMMINIWIKNLMQWRKNSQVCSKITVSSQKKLKVTRKLLKCKNWTKQRWDMFKEERCLIQDMWNRDNQSQSQLTCKQLHLKWSNLLQGKTQILWLLNKASKKLKFGHTRPILTPIITPHLSTTSATTNPPTSATYQDSLSKSMISTDQQTWELHPTGSKVIQNMLVHTVKSIR